MAFTCMFHQGWLLTELRFLLDDGKIAWKSLDLGVKLMVSDRDVQKKTREQLDR